MCDLFDTINVITVTGSEMLESKVEGVEKTIVQLANLGVCFKSCSESELNKAFRKARDEIGEQDEKRIVEKYSITEEMLEKLEEEDIYNLDKNSDLFKAIIEFSSPGISDGNGFGSTNAVFIRNFNRKSSYTDIEKTNIRKVLKSDNIVPLVFVRKWKDDNHTELKFIKFEKDTMKVCHISLSFDIFSEKKLLQKLNKILV